MSMKQDGRRWMGMRTAMAITCFVTLVTSCVHADEPPAVAKAPGSVLLFEDPFTDKLAGGWSWVRGVPDGRRLANGTLEIRTVPGNMWGGANNAKNLAVRALPKAAADLRNLQLEVTVSNQPTEQWEQLGITWYYDDSHMVKLVKERVNGKVSIVMGREEADRTKTIIIAPLETTEVQLRLSVNGNQIVGEYRPGGKGPWILAGKCTSPGKGAARVCLQTYNGPADAEHWARFSRFRISRQVP